MNLKTKKIKLSNQHKKRIFQMIIIHYKLQNMLKSVQEDAFYHAWIKKIVDENEGKENV